MERSKPVRCSYAYNGKCPCVIHQCARVRRVGCSAGPGSVQAQLHGHGDCPDQGGDWRNAERMERKGVLGTLMYRQLPLSSLRAMYSQCPGVHVHVAAINLPSRYLITVSPALRTGAQRSSDVNHLADAGGRLSLHGSLYGS